MLKIAVATDSRYKLNAIKKAIFALDIDAEILNADVATGVPDQPTNDKVQQGASNRAVNILEVFKEADLGVGVEFGYELHEGKYHMICWACIVTRSGVKLTEHSSSLELPKILVHYLEDDINVASDLNQILDKLPEREYTRIFRQYLKKRVFIYESVNNVFLRYLLDKEMY